MIKTLITWRDSFIIDGSIIDLQHKKLIDLINELYSAFLEGKANNILAGIIEKLADYTIYHFKEEEDFFERVNYYRTDFHKKQHADFVQTVLDFKRKLKEQDVGLSYEIMNFLRDWLQKHILDADKKYVPYLEK